jgi:copper(I)-binding protein
MVVRRIIWQLLLIWVAGACNAAEPTLSPGQLSVIDAVAYPAPLAGGNGAVYFTIYNGTEREQRLVTATSPTAQTIELHESIDDNGVMRMIHHPDGFAIPVGADLTLEPGGKHLMLVGLAAPLEVGDTISVTLHFEDAEPIPLSVPVDAHGADAGHAHDAHP